MNILFIATESVPYCKTGGVADVVRGLARELYAQGHNVRIVIPCYRGLLDRERMEEIIPELTVSLGRYSRRATIWKANDEPLTYLIDHYFYFDRDNLDGYLDDYERFLFFTRAALEMLKHDGFQQKEQEWFPQIIQGFDWATGFIPFWLSDYEKNDSRFASTRFVLSIQNIKDVGIFGSRILRVAQQESRGFFPQIWEENERISFLGRGILFANKLVTVNPEYNTQNPLPESAQHLAPAIADRVRQKDFIGIRNAIDYEEYDPSEDDHITGFKEHTLPNRIQNKLKLQQEFGFEPDKRIPMIGMVSQLIQEKGFALFPEFKAQVLDRSAIQFVALLDPKNTYYTTMFQTWEQEWREQQGNRKPWRKLAFDFDERLARRIYAGCDILLFPFKEDPCGAQQFIVMHYGAIPVVHETGALRDSVIHFIPGMNLDNVKNQGVGFAFREFTPEAFVEAVRSAIELYNTEQQTWNAIQRHNMREDFSWFQPVKQYLHLYQEAIQTNRVTIENGKPLQLNRDAQLLQTLLEIDSLPGLHVRDPQEMLKQAARLVRETIQCDAVYVWTVGEGEQARFEYLISQKMQLVSQSLDHHDTRMPPDEETLNILLNHGTTGALKRFTDLDRSRICQPIPNLSDSEWIFGWSVPITAHIRVLGRIDVLFKQKLEPHDNDNEWILRALATLANSFGFRLEQIRLAQEADQISETAKQLLNIRSLSEATRTVIEQAKHFSRADEAWLYLLEKNGLKPTESSAKAAAGLQIAQTAFDKKEVVYIADLSTVSYDRKEEPFPFRSLIAIPLIHQKNQAVGVLEVAKEKPAAFSREKEQALIKYFAPQAAATLQTNQWHVQRDQIRVDQLKKLTASLIGGGEFSRLLEDVAEVLESQAASLYLVNKDTGNLEIRAAAGYHKPLLDANISYSWGEKGITSWIWKEGKIFKADSLEELHKDGVWAGKTKDLQGREPNAYLGIPLKIVDHNSKEEQVIGVLKFEDRNKPNSVFNDEDVRLGEMMANIIATVVYNTQQSEERLRELSTNLGKLSGALVGSQDTQTLMDRIVNTIAEVLHVDAASLYLANEESTRLVIQAASGYQEPLVKAGASYAWGEGVTGRIAATNQPFQANSLDELREKGGSERGRYDHLYGGKRPTSFYGFPLRVQGRDKPIGVLKVESLVARPFTNEDVLLIEMMGNVIATVVYNTQLSEKRLQELSSNLGKLSGALVGSQDTQTLMDRIVNTIAEVLHVDAASLYLANEESTRLVIQAASGYQEPLVKAGASYAWGEGVTGRIAATSQPFQANSLDVLREQGGSKKGRYDDLYGGKRPISFYGLPLRVQGRDKPIGVLKAESLMDRPFTKEDVLLIEMMGNIIAAVVYNTQISEKKLATFSYNIRRLSDVLTPGGQNTQEWFQKIVDTISEIFVTDAASLYLIDETNKRLVISAASGYQKPLMKVKAFYEWGEGVTGKIASTGQPMPADTLAELRKGTGKRGKYDDLQGGNQPNSYYGVPLKVTGEEKPIGVLKFESLHEKFFTDESRLLIDMMANVIATVIHNTRQGEKRIGNILQEMGMLNAPENASPRVLERYAKEKDAGMVNQLAYALAEDLGKHLETIEIEAKHIFKARKQIETELRPELFERIASWAKFMKHDRVEWEFGLYDAIIRSNVEKYTDWGQVKRAAVPWFNLKENIGNPDKFYEAATGLATEVAKLIKVDPPSGVMDPSDTWLKTIFNTEQIFGEQVRYILLLFQCQGHIDESNQKRLEDIAIQDTEHPYPVLLIVLWNTKISPKQMQTLRDSLKNRNVDVVFAHTSDILGLMESASPRDYFRRLVLRQVTIASPFITMGAVPDELFFGRDYEIKTLTYNPTGHDYAVIGNRKIGKTSLLNKVYSILKSNTQIYSMKVNCNAVSKSTEEFYNRFQTETKIPLSTNTPQGFEQAMRTVYQNDRTPVLLIDEVDRLLTIDANDGEPLIKVWRLLSQERICRFIFFGSTSMAQLKVSSKSDMYNFLEPLHLGYLSEEIASRVLVEPLEKLDVILEDKEFITGEVFRLTSGHPNLVQYIGKLLVDAANQRRERRILRDDILRVGESSDFRDEYLTIIWGDAGPLERLITLLAPSLKFRRSGIEERLNEKGIFIQQNIEGVFTFNPNDPKYRICINHKILDNALWMLHKFSILREDNQVYHFIPQSFLDILHRLPEQSIMSHIQQAIDKLSKNIREGA